MKKIYIICFLYLLFISNCFAQNTELKYYSDYSQDFSGYSVAIYYGNYLDAELNVADEEDFLDILDESFQSRLEENAQDVNLIPLSKLTKNNDWLFRQALNEWDYEEGEVYGVICTDSMFAKSGILLIVVIKGENDFLWRAFLMNENDNLDKLFSGK